MVTIEEKNIKGLIVALKGIHPADYNSMDRLVACVSYLESMLEIAEKQKAEEVTDDG